MCLISKLTLLLTNEIINKLRLIHVSLSLFDLDFACMGISVTRSGDLLDFGQLLKAFGNN